MFLKQLEIKNFRGIQELTLPLDDLCVLIGENNTGKSGCDSKCGQNKHIVMQREVIL